MLQHPLDEHVAWHWLPWYLLSFEQHACGYQDASWHICKYAYPQMILQSWSYPKYVSRREKGPPLREQFHVPGSFSWRVSVYKRVEWMPREINTNEWIHKKSISQCLSANESAWTLSLTVITAHWWMMLRANHSFNFVPKSNYSPPLKLPLSWDG